ncbi:DNA-binding transcriptional activator of the SARP family [Amycolatopsis arida]|uniref:DNA-binding transcriptional activator of the SARP family n=1 Tax=Amycolatopsis arida TaxID=587909 RepID=A0A1I5VA50_9PSEU|nr:AfsR/SARP family transcriptional regulator [Amycolatopsis arida]TDX91205.1 DNA-binding SARP family transcriptional activator [Amycolatopsis arida]SFQ04369.1 DNA-binding transcriptional activator of the SARP family [Amycolatopsis arida]
MLGPLVVEQDGRDFTPTAPKLRTLLGLLVAQQNRMVRTSALIDELWGETPPGSARAVVQTYVHRLRRLFLGEGAVPAEIGLHTYGDGYCLRVPTTRVDHCAFNDLVRDGAAARAGGDLDRASTLLRRALALWHGPAMAGVETGSRLSAFAARMEENRLHALEARIDVDLELGLHRVLVAELKEHVLTFPLHEGFHARLMRALYGCDRRPEALDVYRDFRHRMISSVGLEPSNSLQRLHQSMISGETPAGSRYP